MSELPIVEATLEEKPVSEKVRTLGTLSRLLSYPGNHYVQLVEMLYLLIQNQQPEAAKGVSEFGKYVEQLGEYELEEAYTRTFDVNPSCALEVGWHLFGEDYLRGQFLVKMRGELAKYQIQESGELPDHLTHVLAVIAAMSDEEAKVFVHACVFPALFKMQKALDDLELPYRHLIRCLVLALESFFGVGEAWSEEDSQIPHDPKAYPGQNGPRPPGMTDPLRSYPMPSNGCDNGDGSHVQIVPLQMQYSPPKDHCQGHEESTDNNVKGGST